MASILLRVNSRQLETFVLGTTVAEHVVKSAVAAANAAATTEGLNRLGIDLSSDPVGYLQRLAIVLADAADSIKANPEITDIVDISEVE